MTVHDRTRLIDWLINLNTFVCWGLCLSVWVGVALGAQVGMTCLTTLAHIIKNELDEYRGLRPIKELAINMAKRDEEDNQKPQPKT